MSHRPAETFDAKIDITTRCLCGGEVSLDSTNGAGFHSMPPCRDYLRLELTEFVIKLRKHYERTGLRP
jgi:hypothetical protein